MRKRRRERRKFIIWLNIFGSGSTLIKIIGLNLHIIIDEAQ